MSRPRRNPWAATTPTFESDASSIDITLIGGLGGEVVYDFLLTESFERFFSMTSMLSVIAKGVVIKDELCDGLLGGLSVGSVAKYVAVANGF
nr:hypothetical protein [Tanacetum cinerariifolium]